MSSDNIPQTMHGVQLVKYGPPKESLVYKQDIPVPKIKTGTQVLIRVKATGVNPIEPKIATGNMKFITFSMGFPCVIGADFSGIIVAKGDKVKDFDIGDEVYGSQPLPFNMDGTYAQYTLVNTVKAAIAKKPKNLTFEQAASAGIPVLTAYQGVFLNGQITEKTVDEKRNILIVGASGGVGSNSILLSKKINPDNYVVGICSGKNADYVTSLGADKVVNYRDEAEYNAFINDKDTKFDIVFDCVGGEKYYNDLDKLLKKNGVYSTAVGPIEHGGSEPIGLASAFTFATKLTYKKLFASHKYLSVTILPKDQFKTKVAPLFEDLLPRVILDDENIIPLKEVAKAHEALLSHRTVGKIVLVVD
jgi:NADPH:quinone reductase-like Zn-dependent oxidoreductase